MKVELEGVKKFTREAHGKCLTQKLFKKFDGTPLLMKDDSIAAKSINQLRKDLDIAREAQRYAESQQEAGYRVLSRSYEEREKLKAEGEQQA